MSILTDIYKKLIIFTFLLVFCGLGTSVSAIEEMSELEVMESEMEDSAPDVKNSYINDIEILGANINIYFQK